MKKVRLILLCLLLPSCAWLKAHPEEVKQIEMTAEQVALEAAKELIKKEYGIVLPPKVATPITQEMSKGN